MLKARSRMISIRLSEDEYSTLVHLCEASGARSVSDLARDAMRMRATNGEDRHGPHDYRDDLLAQIQLLNSKLEELNKRLTQNREETPRPTPDTETA